MLTGNAMQSQRAPSPEALSTQALTKIYGQSTAVDSVSFAIERGAICGFLGPNGAGKTTTIRMLLGLCKPSSGSFRLFGEQACGRPGFIASKVVALLDRSPAYPYLTGRQGLEIAALTAGQQVSSSLAREVLGRHGLAEAADRRIGDYSQGMRQRLGLAVVSLLRRDLVILDEPMNGLDPAGQEEFRAHIRDLQRDGRTVFLSSHLLHDVEEICSHLIILNRGRVVAADSTASLLSAFNVGISARPADAARAALLRWSAVTWGEPDGDIVRFEVPGAARASVISDLRAGGVEVLGIDERRTSLRETFLRLTNPTNCDGAHGDAATR